MFNIPWEKLLDIGGFGGFFVVFVVFILFVLIQNDRKNFKAFTKTLLDLTDKLSGIEKELDIMVSLIVDIFKDQISKNKDSDSKKRGD